MVKKKDDIPDWVLDEIKNAKFEKPESLTRTGYILEVYDSDKKIDAQLYEQVEDGRHIITMDLPKNIKPEECQRGIVYEFTFNQLKAPLSKKTVEFLKKEKEIEISAIYQFDLQKMEALDVASDDAGIDSEE
ncbi:MAG: hypothetical protein QXE84_00105 [Candidatus Nitrosotenuis sp.]|uniref:Uncharacterized protein n=1 Tax=Candidatus Nitrosotenuis uzonensis TaxID=1407055 RepID=A0A812F1X7_9ARCH|nr:hypothetical protein [Candidatus Nitrosotenuis uzonensis]CAE6488887.1 conserved hypothetical protein [Candidatus Nitrosotenuis uzonensis]